jgi:hypothetical protein
LPRENAVIAVCSVPPDGLPPARIMPSTLIGTFFGNCSTVYCTPRSYGIESKPQQ